MGVIRMVGSVGKRYGAKKVNAKLRKMGLEVNLKNEQKNYIKRAPNILVWTKLKIIVWEEILW